MLGRMVVAEEQFTTRWQHSADHGCSSAAVTTVGGGECSWTGQNSGHYRPPIVGHRMRWRFVTHRARHSFPFTGDASGLSFQSVRAAEYHYNGTLQPLDERASTQVFDTGRYWDRWVVERFPSDESVSGKDCRTHLLGISWRLTTASQPTTSSCHPDGFAQREFARGVEHGSVLRHMVIGLTLIMGLWSFDAAVAQRHADC